MARKELAGLAALGALAMMANRGKKGADRDTDTGVDVQPSYAKPTPDLVGMSNMGDSSNTTGEYAPGPSSMMRPEPTIKPRPRPRPVTSATTSAAPPAKTSTAPVNPIDELNRATGAKPMDPNSDRGPNAVTGTELDRNVNNALNALPAGSSGLRIIRNLARSKAEADMARATKLKDYITPEIGMSRPMLPRPGQTYGEGFVMNRKNGGTVKMAKGGVTRSSASSRGDGIASKGKTRGRLR